LGSAEFQRRFVFLDRENKKPKRRWNAALVRL